MTFPSSKGDRKLRIAGSAGGRERPSLSNPDLIPLKIPCSAVIETARAHFKAGRKRVKSFLHRKPGHLVLWLAILSTGMILHASTSDPRNSDRFSSQCLDLSPLPENNGDTREGAIEREEASGGMRPCCDYVSYVLTRTSRNRDLRQVWSSQGCPTGHPRDSC